MTNARTAVVHSYRAYEIQNDTNEVRPVKATTETLKRIGKKPIEGTAETIDASLLDGQGIYRPTLST